MSTHDPAAFVGLEERVWSALVDGDPAADRRLLAADFVGVYPRGIEDRSQHAAHLAAGPIVARYSMSDARIHAFTDDHVLLIYRAEYTPVRDGRVGADESMYVSSMWSRRDDTWVNTFSQDTPAT